MNAQVSPHAQVHGSTLFIVDVWDYYTNENGTHVVTGMTSKGIVVSVPTAFVVVSA